jgi:hypothetical protein
MEKTNFNRIKSLFEQQLDDSIDSKFISNCKSNYIGDLKYGVQGYICGPLVGKTTLMLNDVIDLALSGLSVLYMRVESYYDYRCFIDDINSMTSSDEQMKIDKLITFKSMYNIEATIKYMNAVPSDYQFDVIIMDYVPISDLYQSYNDSIEELFQSIDRFAKTNLIPIITSIQCNRASMISTQLQYRDAKLASQFNLTPIFKIDGTLNVGDIKVEFKEKSRRLKKLVDNRR